MKVFKSITYVAGALTCGLAGYLYKVLQESNYLEGVAQIPKDDILGFHIFSAVIFLWGLFVFFIKAVNRSAVLALLVAITVTEGSFLALHIQGIVVEQPKSLQQQLLDKGQELLDEVKELTEN